MRYVGNLEASAISASNMLYNQASNLESLKSNISRVSQVSRKMSSSLNTVQAPNDDVAVPAQVA
jgi:hypothetical protein